MTIRDSLAQVQALLDKSTNVQWEACERGSGDADLWFSPYEDWNIYDGGLMRGTLRVEDAKAIAAAVNWLRDHGPELMKMLEGKDG